MSTPTTDSFARVLLHPDFQVGPVNPRVFGSFVEHLGRAVYTGIYEPGHARADEHGFRRDVADLTREMGVTVVRYPGGNFVSNYIWEDGVGPVEDRKPFIDLAWRTVEPNTVGTDEFLQWCEREGIEPMMAVNLGTRGVEAAVALLEYCNGEAGSRWADLRIANGREKPYGVKLWCLGNEMDGPWQIGHKDADTYGKLAADVGQAMKRVDTSIELVLCGSSSMGMSTFGEWEQTVLSYCYDLVDHISMHAYYEEHDGDRASFLGSGTAMDRFVQRVVASADAVGAKRRSEKEITISFDEWNVWYNATRFGGEGTLDLQRDAPRIIEDVYSGLDAVVFGDLMTTLLRHTDRIAVACLAQLVNVIAPIMTEPGGESWKQPTFYPFAEVTRIAGGVSLDLRVQAPTIPTAMHGEVPAVTAAATWDEQSGRAALFLMNRTAQEVEIDLDHSGIALTFDSVLQITADHEPAVHGPEHARAVAERHISRPEAGSLATPAQRGTRIRLAPESWTALAAEASRA